MKNRTKRVYITKAIKKQYLYWKILIVVFVVAVCAFGAIDQYTQRYIASLTPRTIFSHQFIQKAQAKEISKVENILGIPTIQTKSANAGESVERAIRRIAKEENFKWPDWLVKIAKCESSLNPKLTNTKGNNPKTSTDRGLFMISDYWHKEVSNECAFSVECSTKFAIKLTMQGRQHEFVCNQVIKK